MKRHAATCLDADPEVRECTDGRFVLYADAMEAIRQAREEALEDVLSEARKMYGPNSISGEAVTRVIGWMQLRALKPEAEE